MLKENLYHRTIVEAIMSLNKFCLYFTRFLEKENKKKLILSLHIFLKHLCLYFRFILFSLIHLAWDKICRCMCFLNKLLFFFHLKNCILLARSSRHYLEQCSISFLLSNQLSNFRIVQKNKLFKINYFFKKFSSYVFYRQINRRSLADLCYLQSGRL